MKKLETAWLPQGGGRISSPRGALVIGGLRGSSGKTVVTLGITHALRKLGIPVQAFKKGPDYIDAAWHSVATSGPCYCLDVCLAGPEAVVRQFQRKAPRQGVALIEGNRGLFDGVDLKGSYSTAELAKLLNLPVLLVVDATKVTRTAAALVLGCQRLDPSLKIGGVVLNRVAGERHREIATKAIESACKLPVLGAIPKLDSVKAPERHLGLVTPFESEDPLSWLEQMAEEVEQYLDLERIVELAGSASLPDGEETEEESEAAGFEVKVGVIRDSAFPFYYPENLEALRRAGAELIWLSAVNDAYLPELDALYLGGGFPETHAERLSGNWSFARSLRAAVMSGLPVYAECGGMIYLGRTLRYEGRTYEMAGVLPLDFEFCRRPQGHGYTVWRVDRENPFYPRGMVIRGHEFHYTRIINQDLRGLPTACAVERGKGLDGSREGIMAYNLLAFYGHVHALGCPEWAEGMVRAAQAYAAAGKVKKVQEA